MKRNLILILLIILIASMTQAQPLSGWLVGLSGDAFWDNPAEQVFFKPRVQFSKVVKVGSDPLIYSFPGMAWRSTTGEVAPEVSLYHQFATYNNWKFLAGAAFAPLIVQTSNDGAIADKGNLGGEVIALWNVGTKFGAIGGLRVDWEAGYTQEIAAETNRVVVTLTLGMILDPW